MSAILTAGALRDDGLVQEESTIAQALRDAILERRLTPGTRLPEEQLAEIFSSSRGRIRRVLLALSQEHIVVIQASRGAFVASPDAAEARAVLAARRMIEVAVMERPCQPLTEEATAILRAIMVEERQAHADHDTVAMIRWSGRFHLELALALGNEVIADIISELSLRTSLIIAIYERQNAMCCLKEDHELLLEAVCAREWIKAGRLMSRHLMEIEQNLDFSSPTPSATSLSMILKPTPVAIRE
ncbi:MULTISPECIES: GntR family transcriptional regulator [Gluconobacter]|uniref:GntR family transcriptional regulator n=1 Tax=Gluconobacter TaxID=441 RepID=UPI0039EAC3AC